MRRSIQVLAATALLVVAASGCGSDSKSDTDADATTTTAGDTTTTGTPSGGTGENAHACDLLTAADIDAALNVAVGEAFPTTDSDVTTCTYKSADGETIVNVFRYERGDDLLSSIRAADPDAKTVSGIGDDAVEQANIGSIATTIGSIGIKIGVSPVPSTDALEQLATASVDHFNNP